MCTFALYFQVFPGYSLVAAANRDESLTRPSAPPQQLWASPRIYGGQDLLAGGTWLGINEHGMLVAVLNRHTGRPADPHRHSRGQLCFDVLKCNSPSAALRLVTSQPANRYNPFNLVIADYTEAYVVYAQDEGIRALALTPGFHLLTNYNLNDPSCQRTVRSFNRFAQLVPSLLDHRHHSPHEMFTKLHPILASHAPDHDPRASVCIHLDGYGTCSSTLLAYIDATRQYDYAFAPGFPCQNTYSTVSFPPGLKVSHPPSTA
ncbi:MAG: NRDE family protein [Candidatus Binatia bacterium]